MKYLLPICFCFLLKINVFAQDVMPLSLEETVVLAQSDAPDVLIARTRLSNSFWVYQSILADYKPAINFSASLADLNRTISPVILPDGTEGFRRRSQMANFFDVSITQDLLATGGRIFASTGVYRLDIFKNNTIEGSTAYQTSPVTIGFFQPIFGFNRLKWNKKIEPLRYEEATRDYAEAMENVSYEAADLFFDVLIAQLNIEAATIDKANADTLYSISQGRFEVGRIAETDLLQIELQVRNNDVALSSANLNLQTSTEALRNFLGITSQVKFDLVTPSELINLTVDAEEALEIARTNRSETIQFRRRLAQAESDLAQARADRNQINVSGSFGLTQSADNLGDAYNNLLNQERFSLGLNVPIADWGKNKSRMKIAASNLELQEMILDQEMVNFEQEIRLKVRRLDLVRQQVLTAQRALEVAITRENMTRNRYYIGKIVITELNLAITEKEQVRRNYVNSLRAFWLAYYDLRRSTLYDFATNKSLVRRVDSFE